MLPTARPLWIEVLRARMEGLRRLHEVAEAAEPVLPQVEPERVTDLAWVTGFMLQHCPALTERMQRGLSTRA